MTPSLADSCRDDSGACKQSLKRYKNTEKQGWRAKLLPWRWEGADFIQNCFSGGCNQPGLNSQRRGAAQVLPSPHITLSHPVTVTTACLETLVLCHSAFGISCPNHSASLGRPWGASVRSCDTGQGHTQHTAACSASQDREEKAFSRLSLAPWEELKDHSMQFTWFSITSAHGLSLLPGFICFPQEHSDAQIRPG